MDQSSRWLTKEDWESGSGSRSETTPLRFSTRRSSFLWPPVTCSPKRFAIASLRTSISLEPTLKREYKTENVSLSRSLSLYVNLRVCELVLFVCFGRYEMAENCADDDEDKSAIRSLRKRVLEKLKAHPTLVQVS